MSAVEKRLFRNIKGPNGAALCAVPSDAPPQSARFSRAGIARAHQRCPSEHHPWPCEEHARARL
eukprot:4896399-Prymnesium_polylepis.1